MPFADSDAKRRYQREWKASRRRRAVLFLGGACRHCGSTESLEFDHVFPESKHLEITNALTRRAETLASEIAKCQLLCRRCHEVKTAAEDDDKPIPF
jgi:5-methylcytosine-specific restriction endonuclease McrA